MLNRQEADILILVTDQQTGAGGKEIQLVFIGQGPFQQISDTLLYFMGPNATDAIEREQMVRALRRGLLPYILQTPLAERLSYEVEELPATEPVLLDPWNYWVFQVGGNASLDGEAQFSNVEVSGRILASRITDQDKARIGSRYDYERGIFLTQGDSAGVTDTVRSLRERFRAEVLYVRTIGPRWSVGMAMAAGSSTFGNTDLDASIKPAIEYNLYPYDEVQSHRFTILYAIGPEYYNFTDTTVYDQMEQILMRHGLVMEFAQTKAWGNISVGFGAEQFLHDPGLYNIYLNPDIEWQIYKGVSLDMGGFFSFVKDRINIAKQEATGEEVLLQIRQLDTNFTYFTYFGVNLRFGSKFNNFVNPRFTAID